MRRVRDNAPYLPALLALAPLRADTTWSIPTENGSGITIRLSSPLTAAPRFGFMPVRVWIENTSQKDGTWRLDFAAGNKSAATGEVATALDLAVPARNNREVWVYVPLAENGVDTSATPARTPSISPIPSTPPVIAGVYPGPGGRVKTSWDAGLPNRGPVGYTREFTITQTGPAADLPNIAKEKLPPGATMQVVAGSGGDVTRITKVTVDGPPMSSLGSSLGSRSPSTTARENALRKLGAAGLMQGRQSGSSSRTTTSPTKPGEQLVTVSLSFIGPAILLPPVPPDKLPAGFTSVDVAPAGASGEVVRTFEYSESVPNPTASILSGSGGLITVGGGGARGGGGGGGTLTLGSSGSGGTFSGVTTVSGGTMTFTPGGSSMSVTDAEAKRVLAPTGLLNVPPSVRTRNMNSGSSLGSGVVYLASFVQTGPALSLPPVPPSAWPKGVVVNVHPSDVPGEIVRTITYVDPAAYAAAQAGAGGSSSSVTNFMMNSARLELQRWGYLRSDPGMTVSQSIRGAGPTGPTTMIYSESGPAKLLVQPNKDQLPANVTVSITQGPLPGESSRNFIVSLVPPTPGSGGTTGVTGTPVAGGGWAVTGLPGTSIGARPLTSPPPSITVHVDGPGMPTSGNPAVSLSSRLETNSATPPVALAAPLEASYRTAVSTAGISGSPSIASVDFSTLPADWRVWSSFHSVILRDTDWEGLGGGHRAALRTWAALGGQILVVPEEAAEGRSESIGLGSLRFLKAKFPDLDAAAFREQVRLADLPPNLPERSSMRFPEKSPLGALLRGGAEGNTWLAIFLVVFAMVVGPVNLFFFAPPGKRHRLFLTMPIIALLGAALLGATIVLNDGFGGTGERRTLVVLVPGDHLAAVFQEQAVQTGFVTKREFPLGDDAVAMLLPDKPSYIVNRGVAVPGGGKTELYRRDARANGDWFRNRWRQAQQLRWVAPTRMRVERTGTAPNGAPIVESTLATTLREFLYADAKGALWTVDELPPGKRITLKPAAGWPAGFITGGTACFDNLTALAGTRAPGRWIARGGPTEVAPASAIAGLRWTTDEIRYAGVATGNGDGAPSTGGEQ